MPAARSSESERADEDLAEADPVTVQVYAPQLGDCSRIVFGRKGQ